MCSTYMRNVRNEFYEKKDNYIYPNYIHSNVPFEVAFCFMTYDVYCEVIFFFCLLYLHHHQPINIPTAGTQAFLTDYPQGEWAITHHAGPVQISGC
jgi:hypothetical protein